MPALTIPKEYERGFEVIKSLSDPDIKRILEVLKDASPASEPSGVLPILRPALPEIQEIDVQKFLETLYSLYLFRSHSEVSIEEFVDDLGEAIRESDNEALRTSKVEELTILKGKLKSLLTVHPLSILSKAHGLRTDSANIFLDAKIISDIRPVWNGDVKEPPEGIVITQTLKLEYSDVKGAQELYLRVSRRHIELLLAVLLRAQEKMSTLESLATQSWMKILDK